MVEISTSEGSPSSVGAFFSKICKDGAGSVGLFIQVCHPGVLLVGGFLGSVLGVDVLYSVHCI